MKYLVKGRSKRSVIAEEWLHWETLQKMLCHSRPPGYRRVKKRGRKIDLHMEWVRRVLESDCEVPRKQRHSAKRIFDRLKTEQGYEGGVPGLFNAPPGSHIGSQIQSQTVILRPVLTLGQPVLKLTNTQ